MKNEFDDDFKDNVDLDVNKKNSEELDKIMTNASKKYDDYFDKKNPIVKAILIALGVIIVLGGVYYIIVGLNFFK